MAGVTISAERARPEHDREPERDERGEADHEHERLGDVLGRHLAEVLRPQEEDRVGREEQRMDASQPARPRHATGDAAKRVQLGASWSAGDGRPAGGQPR